MKKKRPTTLVVSRLPADALDGRQLSRLWRQAIVNVHGSAAGPLPWVVLPDGCILTCAAGDMHYRPASIPAKATCLGSTADHWLALVSVNDKQSHSYTLYDPFSETKVQLPELDAVLGAVPRSFRISKVLMRSTPDDVVVFVSNHRKYPIILVRPGKGMWALDPATSSPFARVIDVAFLGDTLYGITLAEDLFALDIAFDAHGVPTVTGTRHVIKSSKGDDDCGSDGDEDYSESSADDSTENDYGLDDDDDDDDDDTTDDDDDDDNTTDDDDDDDNTPEDDDDDDDDDTPDDDDDDDDNDMEDSDEEMLYGNTLGEDLFAFAIAFDGHESSMEDDDSDVWSTIEGSGDGGVDYSENGADDIGENDVDDMDDDDDDDDDDDNDDDMEDDDEYDNKYEVSTEPKNLIVPIRYMVESRGKILMVRRKLQCPVHHRPCTRTVEVFEADMSACTWAPVENDLGGHTLFISKRFSKSVHAASESMKDACHFIDTRDTFSMRSNVTSALECDSDYDMLVSRFPKEQCTWIFPPEQEL